MIRRLGSLVLAVVLCASCSKKEEYFYSTTYPVTQIEVRCLPQEVSDEALAAQLAQISAEVIATAPVQAGGRYRLDFNRYDGGDLTVRPTEESETIKGTFIKQPASSEMTFTYGNESYTVRKNGYNDEEDQLRVCFEVDLTAHYKEKYGIQIEDFRLTRIEKTSHLYE